MLCKFRVSNFKSFEDSFELDLTDTNGYGFNKDCVKNGIVNNAIVYGHNGVGKSNLALAIFDIIEHLTDKFRNELAYDHYLNAYSQSDEAEFYYEFLINSKIVTYEYRKTDYKTIVYEKFTIDNEELVYFDRKKDSNAIIKFEGAEMLKTEINNSELSVLKYIRNNTDLALNPVNTAFVDFFKFIDCMLYFRSLQSPTYMGLEKGIRNVMEDIIDKGNVDDFESFLNRAGIECKLDVIDELDVKSLVLDFNGKKLPFASLMSTGTNALTLFYYWFQSIRQEYKVSFLFIDEFDAFYHHELSTLVVDELKKTGVQFVLTTHNTAILTNDLLRPDCYFLMNKKKIRSLSKCTSKELREAHNIEKMYKAKSFNVD
ncbi:AAA15 family ATPase/GTPase [Dysgonomonadaceae bacterium PH5-43]|nr:AAA15 family ATPase/GTPase [Dysgonomonadaceae bacterium PH5-43]